MSRRQPTILDSTATTRAVISAIQAASKACAGRVRDSSAPPRTDAIRVCFIEGVSMLWVFRTGALSRNLHVKHPVKP